MTRVASRVNRGPAAAAANRAAILDASQRLFTERGLHVPLNAIAREAGVSQGVLYRHFRSRLDLAFAVFEDNLLKLESIAAWGTPEAFAAAWQELMRQTVHGTPFLELVLEARRSATDYDGEARLRAVIARTLPLAQAKGLAQADLRVDSVILAWRMAFGIVVTSVTPEGAWSELRAVALLGQELPARP